MKKFFLLFFVLLAFSANAFATDVLIAAQSLTQLPFNPSNIGSTRSLTVTVVNGSATVTSSAAFPSNMVGVSGFTVAIGGTRYTVASVASTSSLTLTSNYSGLSGSATLTLYPYVFLRAYATSGFQDTNGQNIQPSTPGTGNFYKQVAVSVVNNGSGNVAYMPEFSLPSTTDAVVNNQAKYVLGFYRTDGSLLNYYTCSGVQQLALQPNTPTTWTAICNYNAPGAIVPPNTEAYSKPQIDQRFPNCTLGQLYYFDADGNEVTCLSLGTGLSITGGVLNSSGGSGGNPGGGNLSIQFNNNNAFGGYTLGQQLTVSGSTLQGNNIRGAVNAVVDYGAVADGATNTLVSLQNAVNAAALTTGKIAYLPGGNYRIIGTLSVPGGVTLVGDGKDKTIISSITNAPILSLVQGSGSYAFVGPKVRDIAVQGSDSGSSQVGILVTDASYLRDVVIENVTISDAGSHGLSLGNVFSSEFKNIYSTSNQGYPFFFNSPNMPSNYFYGLYAGDVSAASPAGYRIKQGNFTCWSCNGINTVPALAYWAILGGKNGDIDGDTTAYYASAHFTDCNIEGAPTAGVLAYPGSVPTFDGLTTFVGLNSSSGSWVAIDYDTDPSLTPENAKRGYIADTVTFSNSPASFYANSQPIRSDGLPPLSVNGRGPQIAGGGAAGMIGSYYNTATSRVEKLARVDGFAPVVNVTTSVSYTSPGARAYRVNCATPCTLTLPSPNYYENGNEIITVFNLSSTGTNVTIAANSGASVNGSTYVLSVQGASVQLYPDFASLDWRVVANRIGAGSADYYPVFDSTNTITQSGSLIQNFSGSLLLRGTTLFSTDNTFNIGAAGDNRPAHVYAGTDVYAPKLYNTGGGPCFTSGAVSPEGSVTCEPGSFYARTNGTWYQKTTGSGNTGWSLFSTSGGNPFSDASALVKNAADNTKTLTLSAASITTATNRTLTAQDANYTIAGTTVPLGGTGATSFTSNGVLYGNGTGAIQVTAAGGAGTLCLTSTAGAAPVWGACSGSAATALSSVTAAVAANTISNGDNAQIWQWKVTTGSKTGWTVTESTASTGASSYLLKISTLATSTAKPIQITASGSTDGVEMSTAGSLGAIGAGAIVATSGDSATAFFTTGQIEAARGGTGSDSSASTGIPKVTAGTWTYNAGISNLASSTSADLRGVLSDETGSGVAVFATSPTLVTPVLGVATATSINKVAITAPATGSTLTIADGKTLTASNTLTFTGTDATSFSFPSTSGAVATADSTTTFTNKTYNTAATGNAFSINGQSITSVSGNTAKVATVASSSSGKCVEWDANNNLVIAASGAQCAAPSTPPFVDSTAIIKGSVDPTKLLAFEVDGFTTGTTRTITPPDASGVMVLENTTQTLTNKTIDSSLNSITLPFSDLASPTASATFSQAANNITFNTTTGLWAIAASGSTGTNSFFKVSSSNASATGNVVEISATNASATINPLLIKAKNANAFQINASGHALLGGGTSASELRFLEPSGSGSNYTAFKAQAQAGDVTYTLPAADGTAGYVLSTNGSGTLSWTASGSGSGTVNSGAQYQVAYYAAAGTAVSGTSSLTTDANGNFTFAPAAATSGTQTLLTVTGPSATGLTASSEITDINFNLNRTVQRAAGAVTTDRAVRFQGRTLSFASASTITNEYNVEIESNSAGTNATLTNSTALHTKPSATTHHGIFADGPVSMTGDPLRVGYSGAAIVRFVPGSGTLNSVFNDNGALSSSATDGFPYISRIDSATNPSGAPTSFNGSSPMVFQNDSSGGIYRSWAYLNSGWRNFGVAYSSSGASLILPTGGGLPFVGDTSAALVGSNNQVRVALISVPFQITFDRVSLRGVSNSAGSNAGFGIYSFDGNTKICDSGAISTTAWSGSANYALSGTCTIAPGLYYFAWTADSTTPTMGQGSATTNFFTPLNSGTGTALGTAANASSAGVLPSALGALTDDGSLAIPIVRFYRN